LRTRLVDWLRAGSRENVQHSVDVRRAYIEMRGSPDPPGAGSCGNAGHTQPSHDFPVIQPVLAETDDPGSGFGCPVSQHVVAFGLDPRGDSVAEILDNGGYFSYPHIK
jgi:hypothetical protein